MTKLNVTTRPIMKSINAAFYDKYTGHFTKAKIHTYNYTTMDDAIIEGDATNTVQDMADQLNESVERVKYRRLETCPTHKYNITSDEDEFTTICFPVFDADEEEDK